MVKKVYCDRCDKLLESEAEERTINVNIDGKVCFSGNLCQTHGEELRKIIRGYLKG